MKLQIVNTQVVEGETKARTQFVITMVPEEADCILDDIQNGDYASTQILNELLTEALRIVPSEYMKLETLADESLADDSLAS